MADNTLKITPEQSAFMMAPPKAPDPKLDVYQKILLDAVAGGFNSYSEATQDPKGSTVASFPIGRGNLDFKSTGLMGAPYGGQSYNGAQFTYPLGKKRSAFLPGA